MDNLSEEEFKKMMKNLDERDKKTMNGFIDFFGGITNNNFENFKFFDKNELEELRNKNAELQDKLDILGAELNKEKEKNKILEIELEIKKYCKVNELVFDLIYYKNLAREYQGNCISKDKLKEIVDECIPKKENIITRELEYTPNANANSFLTQEILSLLKEEQNNVK